MKRSATGARCERGLVLISSLLLLLVVTILALSLFRGFDTQERIAGNIREKQRATHAAESAMQYAQWWLTSGSAAATSAITCNSLLNANLNQGQICSNTFASVNVNPTTPSWQQGGWLVDGNTVGIQYTPPGMVVNATNPAPGTYLQAPSFYIAYLGICADGVGSCYQIDAVGYGGTDTAVSVVESTYEISSGITNRGGL